MKVQNRDSHEAISMPRQSGVSVGKWIYKGVKVLTFVGLPLAGLAYLLLYKYDDLPPMRYFMAKNAYIQNAKACINGHRLIGCNSVTGVYCPSLDPTLERRFPGSGLATACTNQLDPDYPNLLEESRKDMMDDINNRNVILKVYDTFCEHFVPNPSLKTEDKQTTIIR